MNISEASDCTGLPVKTIRYYEDIKLISPARSGNGYRNFSQNDVHKLAFLGRARSLGFSVESCRSLLHLYKDRTRASADVKKIAHAHLREIDQKISELSQMRATLNDLISACAGNDRPDCPILADLAAGQSPDSP
jgi:Cu(I)-responsive transcriptional regulator